MWELSSEKEGKRIYTNSTTGSQCTQTHCYVDREGNKWYAFDNLMMMPYTRSFAASQIISLFQTGFTKEDIEKHVNEMKAALKSTDPEKYEKAYAILLDFENQAKTATNAVKQMSSLVCVYFTMNDEKIDSFIDDIQAQKLQLLAADQNMHSFFLNLQVELIESYSMHLNSLSQIVLPKTEN